jgi:hypothetical protein
MEQSVVEELSGLFLADITDFRTRQALETASVVRRVTLPILRAFMPEASPHDAQERLRTLRFVQPDRDGLHIHDAVREAIAAKLRADNPQQYRAYRRCAYRCFMTELRSVPASDLWRCTADLLYLLENPVVREAFFPSRAHEYAVEPARIEDEGAILDITEQHESMNTARYLTRWWRKTPHTFSVARDQRGVVAGFYCVFDPARVLAGCVEKILSLAAGWSISINSRCHASSVLYSSGAGFPNKTGRLRLPFRQPAGST